jgi:hypothetical protein
MVLSSAPCVPERLPLLALVVLAHLILITVAILLALHALARLAPGIALGAVFVGVALLGEGFVADGGEAKHPHSADCGDLKHGAAALTQAPG